MKKNKNSIEIRQAIESLETEERLGDYPHEKRESISKLQWYKRLAPATLAYVKEEKKETMGSNTTSACCCIGCAFPLVLIPIIFLVILMAM